MVTATSISVEEQCSPPVHVSQVFNSNSLPKPQCHHKNRKKDHHNYHKNINIIIHHRRYHEKHDNIMLNICCEYVAIDDMATQGTRAGDATTPHRRSQIIRWGNQSQIISYIM